MTSEERYRVAAEMMGLSWYVHRPDYVRQIKRYRRVGQFDDANGLSEVVHQFDRGNYITGSEYRGML